MLEHFRQAALQNHFQLCTTSSEKRKKKIMFTNLSSLLIWTIETKHMTDRCIAAHAGSYLGCKFI